LLGRGLCDELITRPEESYRLWCVVVCDLETSRMRWPWPALGRGATETNNKQGHVFGFYEHGNGPSVCIKCGGLSLMSFQGGLISTELMASADDPLP
jgi:hypothetical protein